MAQKLNIAVVYNEILPKRKAHDLYLFRLCKELALENAQVNLICGRGSLAKEALFTHYGEKDTGLFSLTELPILRKNAIFGLSWNKIFFSAAQRHLKKSDPTFVHLSVLKQGYYHLMRKLPHCRYLYEVHELGFYGFGKMDPKKLALEKAVYERADLLVATTLQLKKLLQSPPYSIKKEIVHLPLAVSMEPLPPPPKGPLTLGYVGQLYDGQGIGILIRSLAMARMWNVLVLGGKGEEIDKYRALAESLGVSDRIRFLGFVEPSMIPEAVSCCHAFAAPFEKAGRMPFVAHTKLGEYAVMGRPIVAPDLPIVKEHFLNGGAVYFNSDDAQSLAEKLSGLSEDLLREKLQKEISCYKKAFCPKLRAQKFISLMQALPF